MKKIIAILIFALCTCATHAQVQSTQANFGKNRVQYPNQRNFVWSYLQGANFDVYFTENGRNLAKFILEKTPEIITNTETYLNYHARHKYKIILYNNATDLLQTNIALDIEQYQSTEASLANNHRLVLCMTESRQKLIENLQKLIAKSLALEMIYDGDFQERIQNTNLISLPEWYINGFANYMSQRWNTNLDNQLHDALKNAPNKKFKYHLNTNPEVFGTAFWFFIDEIYGKNTVSNILYLTHTNRNFESALRYALGKNTQNLGVECLDFFENYQKNYPNPDKNNFSKAPQKKPIVRYKNGIHRIYIATANPKKPQRIHKSGLKNAAFAGIVPQPCAAMHPSRKKIGVFYSKKGTLYFKNIEINKDKKTTATEFIIQNIDAVYSATYSTNGQKILITASYKGKIDVAEFYPLSKRTVWLTDDVFDDFNPIYINNENTKIAYASTRPSIAATDSVPPQAFTDIFVLLNTDTARRIYLQGTYTPTAHENTLENLKNPSQFTFTSNQTGIKKYYEAQIFTLIDSIIQYKNTAQKPDTIYKDLIIHNLSEINISDISHYQQTQLLRLRQASNPDDDTTKTQKIVPFFMPEYDLLPLDTDTASMAIIQGTNTTNTATNHSSSTSKTKFYTPVFAHEYAHINFANALTHPDLPTFITSSNNLPNRDFGIVATAGVTDLFENYKIAGGARLSNTLNNNDFFVLYQNRSRRIDKKTAFHYKSYQQNGAFNDYKGIRNTEIIGELAYPINPHSVVRASGVARRTYIENLASDLRPLTKYGDTTYRLTARTEYVFDNTKLIAPNVLVGSRCKGFVETFADFYKKNTPQYGTIIGIDCRSYTSIYKNLIWANRVAANASLGSQKVLYSAGGVDNWLNPKYEPNNINTGNNTITTQALATNLRGFGLGARAGFNYFLINSEVRLPVFSLRSQQSVAASEFIKNIQLLAFIDIGSAWVGANPFSIDNPNNYEIYNTPPVRVLVYTRANPFLIGYGTGIRTKIMGYWLRADYATGIDNNLRNKPMLHLSLGFDF